VLIATDKPVPPGKLPSGVVRRKWALVIGISQFADKKIPQLNYPAKDAQRILPPRSIYADARDQVSAASPQNLRSSKPPS
jgi:hypothetical protein